MKNPSPPLAVAPWAVLALALAAALPAQAADYTLLDLGQLSGATGATVTYATALNDFGQVVGYQYDRSIGGDLNFQAFVTQANGAQLGALGTLAPAGSGQSWWSKAYDINNAGQVVGASGNSPTSSQAFLASGSGIQGLGTLGGQNSEARAINASGQVVGSSNDAAGVQRAFITGANGSNLQAIAAQGNGLETRGTGINASGQAVGTTGEVTYPGLSGDARYRSFVTGPNGSAPAEYTNAALNANAIPVVNAVNDRGQIAVTGQLSYTNNEVFLIAPNGERTPISFANVAAYELGNLGAFGQYGPISQAWLNTLNERGQVGGTFSNGRLQQHRAFISGADGSGVVDVNELSFEGASGTRDFWFESVTDVNNLGQFVATASNGHSYLISAVPEPMSAALLLAGLGVVGAAGRRAKKKAQQTVAA